MNMLRANLATGAPIVESASAKVLLVTAYRWPTTTRLALALSETGLMVDALCLAGHSLSNVKFVSNVYRYRPLFPLRSFRRAIAASRPDIIIPGDDTVAAQLHELYQQESARFADQDVRRLIENSLGDPKNYPVFYSRTGIASAAHRAGLLSPKMSKINSRRELLDQLETIGLPAVIKTDGSFGGLGVAIVNTKQDAERAFDKLNAYHGVARAIKRLVINRDANLILPCLRGSRPQLSIQRLIVGRRVNSAVACWKGAILSQVCVEVVASNDTTGPATVVRTIAHPNMSQAVERLVRAFNLSGLCGFDFIEDSSDQSVFLIDFNPRATQTCFLLSYEGVQPVAAFAAKLRGLPPPTADRGAPKREPIVLFPHWLGNYSGYPNVDPPTKPDDLVRIGLEFQRQQNRFLVKAFRRMKER
jgi:carbamoylphosphate synthase large subunit